MNITKLSVYLVPSVVVWNDRLSRHRACSGRYRTNRCGTGNLESTPLFHGNHQRFSRGSRHLMLPSTMTFAVNVFPFSEALEPGYSVHVIRRAGYFEAQLFAFKRPKLLKRLFQKCIHHRRPVYEKRLVFGVFHVRADKRRVDKALTHSRFPAAVFKCVDAIKPLGIFLDNLSSSLNLIAFGQHVFSNVAKTSKVFPFLFGLPKKQALS